LWAISKRAKDGGGHHGQRWQTLKTSGHWPVAPALMAFPTFLPAQPCRPPPQTLAGSCLGCGSALQPTQLCIGLAEGAAVAGQLHIARAPGRRRAYLRGKPVRWLRSDQRISLDARTPCTGLGGSDRGRSRSHHLRLLWFCSWRAGDPPEFCKRSKNGAGSNLHRRPWSGAAYPAETFAPRAWQIFQDALPAAWSGPLETRKKSGSAAAPLIPFHEFSLGVPGCHRQPAALDSYKSWSGACRRQGLVRSTSRGPLRAGKTNLRAKSCLTKRNLAGKLRRPWRCQAGLGGQPQLVSPCCNLPVCTRQPARPAAHDSPRRSHRTQPRSSPTMQAVLGGEIRTTSDQLGIEGSRQVFTEAPPPEYRAAPFDRLKEGAGVEPKGCPLREK